MSSARFPSLFVSHGSPMLATDRVQGPEYRRWGESLPRPRGILVISAHWETPLPMLGETHKHSELVYDFWGFPEELYDIQYPAPGAPELAIAVREVLGQPDLPSASTHGLDHGVYIPFLHMWPHADVPILQLSLPTSYDNRALYQLGQQLAPLRDQGVLIIGSGSLTHNLREVYFHHQGEPLAWAKAFDDWIDQTLVKQNTEALLQWETQAPHAKRSHPTPEHFRPLLVAAGAAQGDAPRFVLEGFQYGTKTRRSVQFG